MKNQMRINNSTPRDNRAVKEQEWVESKSNYGRSDRKVKIYFQITTDMTKPDEADTSSVSTTKSTRRQQQQQQQDDVIKTTTLEII